MTSQINTGSIVTNYPLAGQDNDSQGFRDNFTAIYTNFVTAKSEISALQANSVLVADLASGTPVVNDLLGSTLSNGLYTQFYGVYGDRGTVSSAANIDLSNGPIQKFTLSGNATLTFTNWPDIGKFAQIYIIIASDQTGVWYPIFAPGANIKFSSLFPTNPVTASPGFVVGGESVASIAVTAIGNNYTSVPTIGFTGGSPITGAITPTAVPNFKPLTASISGGTAYSGNGYTVGDLITLVSNTTSVYTVATINTTFTATTSKNTLASVTVGAAGTFTCTSTLSTLLQVGSKVDISGTNTNTGTINGTANGTGTYYVIATNGSTTFTLSTSPTGAAIATTAGSPAGLTFDIATNVLTGVTDFRNIAVGLTISGTGVPGSTTVTAYNSGAGTITMSNYSTVGGVGTTITYTSSSGPIATLTVTTPGLFTAPTTVAQTTAALTGGGSGARLNLTFGLNAITVTNPGDGYTTTPPSVNINGGGGSGGSANAILTTGTSTKVQVVKAWSVDHGSTVYLEYLGAF